MEIYLEKPSLEEATERIRYGIAWKMIIIIVGRFSVEYKGRASSYLEEGDRIFIIKQDRAILIHRPEGYKPINWQPSKSTVKVSVDKNKLILEAIRDRPREIIRAYFSKIHMIYMAKLYDTGKFSMYLTEKEMQDIISKNLSLIEEGLTLLKREKELEGGKADIVCRDKQGNIVVIELKKHNITIQDVLQLNRYIEGLRRTNKKIRGIIVGTGLNKDAYEILIRLGLEYKIINLKELSRYK